MSDTEIIRYCSPTLAGLKTASLFTTPCDDYDSLRQQILRINAKLRRCGLRLIPLSLRKGRALIYIYREAALAKTFCAPHQAACLKRWATRLRMSPAASAICPEESGNAGIFPTRSAFFWVIRKQMSSASWKGGKIMSARMCGRLTRMRRKRRRHSLFTEDVPNYIQNGWKAGNRLTG